MNKLSIIVVVLGLAACGGGASTRVYKGTSTSVTISGGSSGTNTSTGEYQIVSQSGTDPSKWVFSGGSAEFSATLNGTALSFLSGQSYQQMDSTTTSTVTLSNGTGNMTNDQLSLNFTFSSTYTSGTTTGSSTYTLTYTGTRE